MGRAGGGESGTPEDGCVCVCGMDGEQGTAPVNTPHRSKRIVVGTQPLIRKRAKNQPARRKRTPAARSPLLAPGAGACMCVKVHVGGGGWKKRAHTKSSCLINGEYAAQTNKQHGEGSSALSINRGSAVPLQTVNTLLFWQGSLQRARGDESDGNTCRVPTPTPSNHRALQGQIDPTLGPFSPLQSIKIDPNDRCLGRRDPSNRCLRAAARSTLDSNRAQRLHRLQEEDESKSQ